MIVDRKTNIGYIAGYPPRENAYANDVDTLRASINRHLQKVINQKLVHVLGPNASDTADLFLGRGDSAEMPFATLEGAKNFAFNHFAGAGAIVFLLHGDLDLPQGIRMDVSCNQAYIYSDSVKRQISLGGPLTVGKGRLTLMNLKLHANEGNSAILQSIFQGFIHLHTDIEFSGQVSMATIDATSGGTVYLAMPVTGEVTGPRYRAVYGSRILALGRGPDAIPGTIAGTCDASSVYA